MGDEQQVVAQGDLTPEQQEAEARRCYLLHQSVVSALTAGRAALWQLAEALAEFDERAGWIHLGYETKSEWLADPDITITQRTFVRLVRAWRVLHGTFGIDTEKLQKLEMTKVDIVLPAVQQGKRPLVDAINDVETLGVRDLRTLYWGAEDPSLPPSGQDDPSLDQEPGSDSAGANGPVRASDGTPVAALLEAADGHELADEDEMPVTREYVYISPAGVWAIDDVLALERVAPPPTTKREAA